MYIQPLIEGEYFHIYNRGINGENIFKEQRNYYYFVQQYIFYCAEVMETLAYSLLKNHFHLLVYVKENVEVKKYNGEGLIHLNASKQLSHFFNSYSQSINKAYKRTGSLFENPFKRKLVDDNNYLTSLIYYCHYNPQLHGFVTDFKDWEFSSYHSIAANDNSFLASQKVLDWFGGIDIFKKMKQFNQPPTGLIAAVGVIEKRIIMKAIVDCNSFYCSCERLFKPHLDHHPVVVLSNNDGCIVSRSDEAKKIGVEMAGPYFKAKPLIEKYNVATFSSNYNLYGDLSWRVMETLRMLLGKDKVEVYSVDEAFLDLDDFAESDLQQVGAQIKETVEQWTGIKVSVGVAPTKVLSKAANHLAKKNKIETQGVVVLQTPEEHMKALQQTPVEDVWGVGRANARNLCFWNVRTAWDLRNVGEEWAAKHLGGVVGVRLIKELRGEPSIIMKKEVTVKKMIATTRMFGQPVTDINDIKEAVATYTSRAAEKLRRQQSAANIISVFVVPKEMDHSIGFRHGPSIGSYVKLPVATSFTNALIKPAVELVERLYEKGTTYKKAGVILSGLVPDRSVQSDLFIAETKNNERRLMHMVDNVNFSMRNDIIKFAASGTNRDWKMRQELRSPRYTTRWDELMLVK